MNVKELALFRVVHRFENIGFMAWHARVLRELTCFPQPVKELARKTGLFHYQLEGVFQDLLSLRLIEYTRYGVQIVEEWSMLLQLVECCEEGVPQHAMYDYDAAFEVATPRVMALQKKYASD